MKAADMLLGDPATKKALQIQWPLFWAAILKLLPVLIPIILSLLAKKGVSIVSASQEPLVTDADCPSVVKQAIAATSLSNPINPR